MIAGLTAVVLGMGAATSVTALAKVDLPIDYFEVAGGLVMEGGYRGENGERGLLVTSSRRGGELSFSNLVAGDLSLEFTFLDEAWQEFSVLLEGEKASFEIGFLPKNGACQAYVRAGEKNCGLIYSGGAANTGVTNAYNESGSYTDIGKAKNVSLQYAEQDGKVIVNGKTVWNLHEESMDGRSSGCVIEEIGAYCVTLRFGEQVGESSLLLTSVGSQRFDHFWFEDQSAPVIDVSVERHAVAGQPYALPVPAAYDFAQGAISGIDVEIFQNGETVMAKQAFRSDLMFTPSVAGEYTAVYSCADGAGYTAEKTVVFRAETEEIAEISYAGAVPAGEYGTHAKIVLPFAEVKSNLSEKAQPAYLTVFRGEEEIEGWAKIEVRGEMPFVFDAAGTYRAVYEDQTSSVREEFVFTVTDDIAWFETEEAGEWPLGEVFTVPDAVIYAGGAKAEASCIVRFPDGGMFANRQFLPEQSGVYELIYSAELGGVNYEKTVRFTVKSGASSLFTGQSADVAWKVSSLNENVKGIGVECGSSGKVIYNNIVDLNNFTKDDLLIELISDPSVAGTGDFTMFYITLTDVYDEDNYITIRARDAESNSTVKTYLQARAAGQLLTGLENGLPNSAVTYGGTVIDHSFAAEAYALVYPVYENTIRLYFDYAERALYTYVSSSGQKTMVIDFDNPDHFDRSWGGFTTGEVKISIGVGGVKSRARYLIKNIAGQDFTGDALAKDTTVPKIVVDSPEIIPAAKTGAAYPVFGFTAKDIYDKNLKTSVRVYYGREGAEVGVIEGKFTPILPGKYTIVYTASDAAGNTAEETREVFASAELEPLTISLTGFFRGDKLVGTPLTLKTAQAAGGAGNLEIGVTAECDGEIYEVTGETFLPPKAGEYVFTYKATDYIGQSVQAVSESVTIGANLTPVLEKDAVLPPAFIAGYTYELPALSASDYSVFPVAELIALPKVSVGGTQIAVTDGKFTVPADAEGEISVKYSFVSETAGAKTLEKEYLVPVVSVQQNGSYDVENYFLTENFEKLALINNIAFTAENQDGTLKMIRPVTAGNFEFIFTVDKENHAAEGVVLTFTDAADPQVYITLDIDKNARVSVNGGARVQMAGSFDGTSLYDFVVKFSNVSCIFSDARGTRLARVQEDALGNPFAGFKSGEVYISMQTYGVQQGGVFTLNLKRINDQNLSNFSRDTTEPRIELDERLGGQKTVGETVVLYPVKAIDVLGEISSFTVSVSYTDDNLPVKDVNGNAIMDFDATEEYSFIIERVGNIAIAYTAKDTAGQVRTVIKQISVPDTVLPEISIEGNMPSTAKVGQEIVLPSVKATDNLGEECYTMITVTSPSAFGTVVKNGRFTFTEAGVYYVRFVAYDANFNSRYLEYRVTVS